MAKQEHKFTDSGDGSCSTCGLFPEHHRKPRKPSIPKIDYAYHQPDGDPCRKCEKPAKHHRVKTTKYKYHEPMGDPCSHCGWPANRHKGYNRPEHKDPSILWQYYGIDGEGQGRRPHKYVFLAASDETGENKFSVSNPNGLTTEQCLDFILEVGEKPHVKLFAYAFNYDLTKILEDLPDDKLYKLFRPQLRARPGKEAVKGPFPVKWNGYTLNLQASKFTVRHKDSDKLVVIWDIWRFFGCKFTKALQDWKVGSKELIERMTHMKNQRSDFDKLSNKAVEEYCFEECQCMAELARKLYEAHKAADLKLTSFYGAGSSASAMLKKMGIKDKLGLPPYTMQIPLAAAFFGGRFENRWIGIAKGPIRGYDIASAYPYHASQLPCLIHMKWERTTNRADIEKADAALVRYSLPPISGNIKDVAWGPFPYRTVEGSICFPASSGGGWVWKEEYLAGEKHFENVGFKEAWVGYARCPDSKCKPFNSLPNYYIERCRIGKEGPGLVIKLGINSCYGKLAQSVGGAQFNSWAWAGMITSGCRAQILELIGRHKDRKNLLMIATDGIYTREELKVPDPVPTGTESTGKPLGCWEHDPAKDVYDEMFCARPGIYFPMNPTENELNSIRARGLGKAAVLNNWKKIVDSYHEHGISKPVPMPRITRFCGAKTSVSRSKHKPYVYKRAGSQLEFKEVNSQAPVYGQWVERDFSMDFDPMPKRDGVLPDGNSLRVRIMPQEIPSLPYIKALDPPTLIAVKQVFREIAKKQVTENPEIAAINQLKDFVTEQPDLDINDYELEYE